MKIFRINSVFIIQISLITNLIHLKLKDAITDQAKSLE